MRLVIERNAMLRSMRHVRSIIQKRTTIPILANVLLRADPDQGLMFKGTDLEREVTEIAPAQVDQAGAVTAPGHLLYEIASKMPDGAEILLFTEPGKDQLMVSSGRSRFTLGTLEADDFPSFDPGEFTHRFELSAGELRSLFDHAGFAMSTEETRYYLCGIYLHQVADRGANYLRVVATDGHQLARINMPLPAGADGMPGIILPRPTVQELTSLLDDKDATVGVSLSTSKARFEIGAVTLTTKLIDGTFPDYQRVIPKDHDKRLTVDKGQFMATVDRVSTINYDRMPAVKLSIDSEKVVFSVKSDSVGTSMEEMAAEYKPIKKAKIEPLEIGFNAKYLLTIMSKVDDAQAEIMLHDPGSPALIKNKGNDDTLFVLMPMRV